MRITGTVVCVRTEMEPKPLNVRCAMLERELQQGNAWHESICLFSIITVCRTENYGRNVFPMLHASGVCFCFVLNRNDKITSGRIISKGESKKIAIRYGFCDR